MANLRRTAGNGDGPTARFLYAVLRQLDTKSIDWNEVAEVVECTNGHAARMRYSRFRAHMEGTNSSTRRSEEPQERRKTKTTRRKKEKAKKADDEIPVKPEPSPDEQMQDHQDEPPDCQQEPDLKNQGLQYQDPQCLNQQLQAQPYQGTLYQESLSHDADDEASPSIKNEDGMDCNQDPSFEGQYIKPEPIEEGPYPEPTSAFADEMANLSVDQELATMRVDFLDACRNNDFGLNEYLF